MNEIREAAERDERRTLGAGGWKCYLGLHRYTRWSKPRRERDPSYESFVWTICSRECIRCGKYSWRRVQS